MEKDNKWGMFRNFMYNELGISKEDIRTQIKEAVHEEAEKMIANTFDNFDVERTIKNTIQSQLNYNGLIDYKEIIAKKLLINLI